MFKNYFILKRNLNINFIKRYAGHSKWQNIKNIKQANDDIRQKLFQKLGQRIKVSIQEAGGNANPGSNLALSQAIEAAKSKNMPINSIQNYIKNSQLDKSKDSKTLMYEVKGLRGEILIISTLTDNPPRTLSTLKPIIRKHKMEVVKGLQHLFDKKCVILAELPANLENPDEKTIEHAIEIGAEEVNPTENEKIVEFTGSIENIVIFQKKLESLNYRIKEADVKFIPQSQVVLSDQELEDMSKLYEKLELHPDVMDIFDNIA